MKMGRETQDGEGEDDGEGQIYTKYCICKFKFIVFNLSLSRMDAHFRVLLDVRKKKKLLTIT